MKRKGLLHALLFDTLGGAKILNDKDITNWKPEDGTLWLHLDYTASQTIDFVRNKKHLNSISKDFLLTEDTRPRVTSFDDCLLFSLRGVNLNPHSDPEDMVGVRLWANDSLILTTIKRNLLSIADIVGSLEKGNGPKNSSEFIISLSRFLIIRMEPTIENIEDNLAEIEDETLEIGTPTTRRQLSKIRREAISLRRYLLPQEEAMHRLHIENLSWFTEKDRAQSKEVTDQLRRYIENLNSIRERSSVIHEELVSNLSEQLNNRMYVLSLITVVFLPLSFLTGLFGINVGGIPGSQSTMAFALFVGILFIIGIILFLLLKRKKWF